MKLFAIPLWLLVTLAFLLLIGAWTSLITVASKNRPDSIPLQIESAAEKP